MGAAALTGAARLLQAIAKDNILPPLKVYTPVASPDTSVQYFPPVQGKIDS